MELVRRLVGLLLVASCGRLGFAIDSTANDGALAGDTGSGSNDTPPPPGLVVWFPFDSDDGAAFTDVISGLQGTCTSPACPTVTTAHRGSGYVFDGIDDCIVVPDAPQFQQSAFTLAVWGHQRTSGMQSRMTKQLASQNNSWQVSSSIGDSTYFLYNAGANDLGRAGAPNIVSFTTFQHFAATFDSTALRVYLNGTQTITDVPTGPVAYDGGRVALGCTAHAVLAAFFDGTLDEIQIYNRVLSPSEVMQLAQQ